MARLAEAATVGAILDNWTGRFGRRWESDRTLRAFRSCAEIARANLMHNGLRSAIALAGTAVPILLLVLQLALLQGVRSEVVRLYRDFNFDIAVLPSTYEFLMSNGTFDRVRLAQADSIPGVKSTFDLNVTSAGWSAGRSAFQSPVILVGVDDAPDFIADPDIRQGMEALKHPDAVLIDRYSAPALGPLTNGTEGALNFRPVTIEGSFALGLFFYADGAAVVANSAFAALAGADSRQASLGLIQVAPGADPERVARALSEALPDDVRILSRRQLLDGEQAFFLSVKPLGIMVMIGMAIAALAGTVVLWQVLSSEIARRIHEFATLSAIGFAPEFVLGVGLCETVFLGLAALLPALAVAEAILGTIAFKTHLPTNLTPGVVLDVVGVVAIMCALCAASVVYRIRRADPASLF